MLQTTPVDVVLTDSKMPEMDGLTLLKKFVNNIRIFSSSPLRDMALWKMPYAQ
ncbi:MAG: hypothetical protein WB792_07140 [Desulfobacterales bacterium]